MQHFKPLADRVLVQRKKAADATPGGLYIPDNAKEKPVEGTVMAVGRGRVTDHGVLIESSVRLGDVVLFDRYAGVDVPKPSADGQPDLVILREEQILAVLGE